MDELEKKINQLYEITLNNTSDIEKLITMVYNQSVAINNLLTAYNQYAVNSNNTTSNTNSILRKMADMEIKTANSDITLQDISDSISLLKDDISNLYIAIKDINMYGGNQW